MSATATLAPPRSTAASPTARPAQPFVKWVGGKRSLLPELQQRLPEGFNNYFEPFVGGGALYFSLAKLLHDYGQQAVLCDSNFELTVAYQVVKKQPHRLIAALQEHAAQHGKAYFYRVRKASPSDPVEIAARFIYLNKTCYNGLYRVNKSGGFNAPLGNYQNPNIVATDTILACSTALQSARILMGDFTSIEPEPGDFVYFDPPYHPTDDQSFTQYTKENFTEVDQVRLRDFALELHRKGVHVMVSNSKCRFVEHLYRHRDFHQHVIRAPRLVNCKPGGRNKVEELLITNY